MFETIVNERASREVKKLEFYENVDTSIIGKSNLSPFVKNFIISEAPHVSTNEELEQQVNKAVKLLINYSIRPKWTILNFVFGSLESKRVEEVSSKLEIFPFYKFYTEVLEEYIDRNAIDFITRVKAEMLIDEMNLELKEKLMQNVSGIKIKNFLLNVFRLKYDNESEINLDSTVPYSFIKIFLEDKKYNDLLEKFESFKFFKENDLISYKDIIKIFTDKFVPQVTPEIEKASIVPELKKEVKETEKKKIKIELDDPKDDTKVAKPIPELPKVKVDTDKDPLKKEETLHLSPVNNDIQPVKEKTYSRYDVYSNEREEEKKKAEETEQQKDPIPQSEQTEIIETVKLDNEVDDSAISDLFTMNEKKEILSKIYNNSKSGMKASFKILQDAKNWNEATAHLKRIILDNKVDIYHRKIVFFVDMLNEHFIKKEKQ